MPQNQTNQDIIYDKIIDILENTISIVKILKSQTNQQQAPIETVIESTPKDRLIPVTKWNDYYDFPALGGLRGLIFNKDTNGFDKVIRRIGRRVLIKEDEFFKWIENNQR